MRALALGWLAGTGWLQWQPVLPSPLAATLAMALSLLLLLAALRRPQASNPRAMLAALLLCGLLAGAGWSALRAQSRMADELPTALEGRDLQVTGVVASLPDELERGQRFRVSVESAFDGDQPVVVPPKLALGWYRGWTEEAATMANSDVADPFPSVRPGERWRWTVRLRRPHGFANPLGFDEEAWLLSEGVRATGYVRDGGATRLDEFVFSPRDAISRLRLYLRERILQSLPNARHAGVIVALVIGDQRGITRTDRQLFNLTGIGHLVSISGLHITMIAALCSSLLQWPWRHASWGGVPLALRMPAHRAGAIAGLLAAAAYVALAGFGVPALRTLLMLAVVTLALCRARLLPVSRVLAAALLSVLVLDPWAVLWPGFWLSFAAIACILYASDGRIDAEHGSGVSLTPLFAAGAAHASVSAVQDKFAMSWQYLRASLAPAARMQLAVTAGLVPLGAGLFGQVSLLGPLANAVAIPLVSFAITPLALLGSVLPQPLCGWLLHAAHGLFGVLVDLLQDMVDGFHALTHAAWRMPQPDPMTLAIALVGTVWLLAPRGWPWRWAGALCWLPMLVAQPSAPSQGFWLTALDIGQGNAVLVETAKHRLLYDTGPAWPSGSDAGERVILPYLQARGIARLDAMMISHADLDHAGGAGSLLAAMPVGWLASSLPASHRLVAGNDAHVACVAGQRWQWDGVWFEVLHPLSIDRYQRKANARSCTLRISFGERAALLAGDIERPQEQALVARAASQLKADLLLAPHHGSGTSSTPVFLDTVAPGWALFQVGYRNRYRHPKAEVEARYRDRGIRVQRSDQAGAVTATLDQRVRVTSWRCEQRRYWRSARCEAD